MLEFNNNHIFTGYLKQLLSSFNLPVTKVYSMNQYEYYNNDENTDKVELNVFSSIHRDTNVRSIAESYDENNKMRYIPYIKDNCFQEYVKNSNGSYTWEKLNNNNQYYYNQKIANFTKNLIIKDNIYDSYTHEYLGNYLRFQRDYHNIDLMPLYNCFSNRVCSNLDIKFNITNNESNTTTIEFDSTDTKYKIYMIPIKFFQKYTIAIDSDLPIEFCCWFYNKYQKKVSSSDADTIEFIKNSYQCVKSPQFGAPFIYSKLYTEPSYFATKSEYLSKIEKFSKWASLEDDLRLFIKVPFLNSSTITILEGDYLGYNDRKFDYELGIDEAQEIEYLKNWNIKQNHWVTNYEKNDAFPDINSRKFKPITFLQLLSRNTGKSYPFADRLIEYLLGNVITNFDPISDNIYRVQEVMELNKHYTTYKGLWDNKIRPVMYDFINNNSKTKVSRINHDVLGYIDKDVEKYYSGYKLTKKGLKKVTISNINIYPELYNKEKK